ncbi:hypothetical protein LCGC14_1046210 [marine sediment metagenome]|uniref:Glycosyltransferase 2-like domain-containing protein n=1 Tax=marine sediment metagenome TaxID=412755 RepID=A0A0F9MQA5_9ZZZZ
MPKVLFVIFTTNRFYYLRNCTDSLLEFVDPDDCQVMIVDICTIEDGIQEYYDSFQGQIIVKKFEDRVPNELYRAMNYAIEYCRKNKIPIVNFIQDDYQYLYHLPGMVDNVLRLFKKDKSVGQIQTNLVWKRKKVGGYKCKTIDGVNYAILQDKIPVDTGFTQVSIYKKIGLYPSGVISYDQKSYKTHGFGKNRYKKMTNGELWFGGQCRKRNIKRAISLHPNMTMMFDCAYVRKWQRFGRYFPPPNKYYIKTFGEEEISRVRRANRKKKFLFIEKITQTDGWVATTYDKHNREGIVENLQ